MHCHLQLLRPCTKGCCGSDVQPKIGDREFKLGFAGLLFGNLNQVAYQKRDVQKMVCLPCKGT